MKTFTKVIPLFALAFPLSGLAAQVQGHSNNPVDAVGGSIAIVANDAGKGSDFDASARFNVFAEKKLSENFSFQAGLSQTTDAEHSDEDNTGEYKLSIRSSDVFAGAKITFNPQNKLEVFARGGVLYYYSQVELEESFFGLKESGTDEEVEEGTGFYFGGGAALAVSRTLQLQLEVSHLQRSEYFEDASRSFDFKEIGVTFGVAYTLP